MPGSLRSWLYLIARLMGDDNAVERGRGGRRIGRRLVGGAFRSCSARHLS
jgi:hypothetical protein